MLMAGQVMVLDAINFAGFKVSTGRIEAFHGTSQRPISALVDTCGRHFRAFRRRNLEDLPFARPIFCYPFVTQRQDKKISHGITVTYCEIAGTGLEPVTFRL